MDYLDRCRGEIAKYIGKRKYTKKPIEWPIEGDFNSGGVRRHSSDMVDTTIVFSLFAGGTKRTELRDVHTADTETPPEEYCQNFVEKLGGMANIIDAQIEYSGGRKVSLQPKL
jgi:hypothetical protein